MSIGLIELAWIEVHHLCALLLAFASLSGALLVTCGDKERQKARVNGESGREKANSQTLVPNESPAIASQSVPPASVPNLITPEMVARSVASEVLPSPSPAPVVSVPLLAECRIKAPSEAYTPPSVYITSVETPTLVSPANRQVKSETDETNSRIEKTQSDRKDSKTTASDSLKSPPVEKTPSSSKLTQSSSLTSSTVTDLSSPKVSASKSSRSKVSEGTKNLQQKQREEKLAEMRKKLNKSVSSSVPSTPTESNVIEKRPKEGGSATSSFREKQLKLRLAIRKSLTAVEEDKDHTAHQQLPSMPTDTPPEYNSRFAKLQKSEISMTPRNRPRSAQNSPMTTARSTPVGSATSSLRERRKRKTSDTKPDTLEDANSNK